MSSPKHHLVGAVTGIFYLSPALRLQQPRSTAYPHGRPGRPDRFTGWRELPAFGDFTFRVAGKQPGIRDAVTGNIRPANTFHQTNACTTLSLDLDAFSSYFIVFRKPVALDARGAATANFPKLTEVSELKGPWNTTFDTKWGGPAKAVFPELISWTKRPEDGIMYYSGKATYKKTFDLALTAEGNSLA